jgi:hypothetical protein
MIVLVSYGIDGGMGTDPIIDEKLAKTAEALGGKEISSGSGFGSRDLEFEFDDQEVAERFAAQCTDAGFETMVYDEDDEDEDLDDDDQDGECDCEYCRADINAAREKLLAKQDRSLAEDGYYIHAVVDDASTPYGYNIHTHGLENAGHLDIQVVAPIDLYIAHNYVRKVAEMVMDGKRFKSGDRILIDDSQDVFTAGFHDTKYYVKLVDAKESGRSVLRMILPDPAGNLDMQDLTRPYVEQYEGVENNLA